MPTLAEDLAIRVDRLERRLKRYQLWMGLTAFGCVALMGVLVDSIRGAWFEGGRVAVSDLSLVGGVDQQPLGRLRTSGDGDALLELAEDTDRSLARIFTDAESGRSSVGVRYEESSPESLHDVEAAERWAGMVADAERTSVHVSSSDRADATWWASMTALTDSVFVDVSASDGPDAERRAVMTAHGDRVSVDVSASNGPGTRNWASLSADDEASELWAKQTHGASVGAVAQSDAANLRVAGPSHDRPAVPTLLLVADQDSTKLLMRATLEPPQDSGDDGTLLLSVTADGPRVALHGTAENEVLLISFTDGKPSIRAFDSAGKGWFVPFEPVEPSE